ncbi:MAG: hypothetical protein QM831_36660 [Kofleriaceae bacterium]
MVLLASCAELPPPPILPPHADAAPGAVGSDTAMLIVGGATDISGHGVGAAIRFEHQQTDRTTLGLDLTGGRIARGTVGGKGSGSSEPERGVFGLRGYGRYSFSENVATGGGLGVSIMTTGLVTGTADTSVLFSRPSDTFIPVGQIDLVFAQPLHNVKFHGTGGDVYDNLAGRSLLMGFDFDGIIPIESGNRFSFDIGWLWGLPIDDLGDGDFILHTSFADTQHWD